MFQAHGLGVLVTLTERGPRRLRAGGPGHLSNERRLLAALDEALAGRLRKLLVEFEGTCAASSRLGPVDDAAAGAIVVSEARRSRAEGGF